MRAGLTSIWRQSWQRAGNGSVMSKNYVPVERSWAVSIAGQPIVIVRDRKGELRAFYNVCKHRGHQLLTGEGTTGGLVCPYHAWTYRLDGQLSKAPHTANLKDFRTEGRLSRSGSGRGVLRLHLREPRPRRPRLWRRRPASSKPRFFTGHPMVDDLTFGHRLTYEIESNWKNVVDNFLECYHLPDRAQGLLSAGRHGYLRR